MAEEESVAQHVAERGEFDTRLRAWPGNRRGQAAGRDDDQRCDPGGHALLDRSRDAAEEAFQEEVFPVARYLCSRLRK